MGNIRQKPLLEKKTVMAKTETIICASSSMCGWREFMEDTHICYADIEGDHYMSLFGVFDGHGGPEIASFAKTHFLPVLLENGHFITKNYEKALVEVFLQLDSMMQTKAGKQEIKKVHEENVKNNNVNLYEGDCIAGSTANVVLLTKDYIYCANAGDSRAMAVIRDSKYGKPKCKQLSTDHKPEEDEQKKRILKAGGTILDGRINKNLNLSRSLGDFAYKKNTNLSLEDQIITAKPDVVKVPRREVSHVLIGCDGIWERKSCQQMTKWLHKKVENMGHDLGKILESLFDEEVSKSAEADLGMDNMTAILVEIKF